MSDYWTLTLSLFWMSFNLMPYLWGNTTALLNEFLCPPCPHELHLLACEVCLWGHLLKQPESTMVVQKSFGWHFFDSNPKSIEVMSVTKKNPQSWASATHMIGSQKKTTDLLRGGCPDNGSLPATNHSMGIWWDQLWGDPNNFKMAHLNVKNVKVEMLVTSYSFYTYWLI